MTLEQLENGYGHHHPEFQEEAAEGVQRPALSGANISAATSAVA
jgi:hypothetical protein